MFLLRGCDTLRVTLCPGVAGKELYHALRIAGTQARPQLRRIEFPCNIQNRHSYGFAALQLGGKTLATIPDYCLSAGDFPLTSEEDFDNFGGSPDLKLEKKGRYPNTLTSWFRAALREAWAFSCVFGEEYYAPLEKAASHLLRLGEQHGYAWTATAVYSAWEELWARFCEEARELDRRVRREMKDESPTFARLKFFALSPGPDGQPWLQLPGTFRLEDDTQYFCTDMLPRMQRQLSRACWSGAQKRGVTAPSGGRAAGSEIQAEARSEPGRGQELTSAKPHGVVDGARVAGGKPEAEKPGGRSTPEAASKLLGPSLHPREAARSLDHRPKDAQGQYLCWDHLCHRGCNKGSACPHSHKSVPKWSGLDYSVQLQLLRRGENLPAYGPNRPPRPLPPSKKASTLPVLLQKPRPTAVRAAGTPPGQGNKLTTLLMTSTTSTLPIRKESFPSCWGMLEIAGGLTRMLVARPLSDLANPSRTHPVLRLCAKLTPTNTASGHTQKACWVFICATVYCVYVKIQEHRPARRTSPASSRKLSTAGAQSSPRLRLSFLRIKESLARPESSPRCSSPTLTGTPPLEPALFRGTAMASGQCLTIGTNSVCGRFCRAQAMPSPACCCGLS